MFCGPLALTDFQTTIGIGFLMWIPVSYFRATLRKNFCYVFKKYCIEYWYAKIEYYFMIFKGYRGSYR